MKLHGRQLCCGSLCRLRLYFICCLSLWSPVWTETERLQGKLQRSKLELKLTDGVTRRHSVVSRGKSERKTQTVNQLVPTSPVAKKCSLERPIRTESTESVTDWPNRMEVIGFLPILDTEAWWENTEISPYSQTMSLTNSCLWVL